ncbi:MAG: chorismate synthase [Acidobacteria bacterium]|nr:MAG: chorismate synthase [Acidobacteriota bacterium]
MTGNSIGQAFRITTAGESHGRGNTVIIDGCPAGLPLQIEDIQKDLDRRRPGQSQITTQRLERDVPQILSGVFEGKTTGSPIAVFIPNEDQKSKDYSQIMDVFRPGHADYTYWKKYGIRDYRGGGRASARETVARVAAGAIARKWLATEGVEVLGFVHQVGTIQAHIPDACSVSLNQVESNAVRCPDESVAAEMIQLIETVRKARDSIGGAATLIAKGLPAGLGEPVFDRLKADLAKSIMSIPAVTAFEVGSGVQAATMRGSEHNDAFHTSKDGRVTTKSNHHGGMLGGISSGMPLILRATVKPTSSISREQETVDKTGKSVLISIEGRHDPCLLPRFIPIGEAMVLLTLADHFLRWKSSSS